MNTISEIEAQVNNVALSQEELDLLKEAVERALYDAVDQIESARRAARALARSRPTRHPTQCDQEAP